MKIQAINSSSNNLLKSIRGLHQRAHREKTGQFLIEGPKPLFEAFKKGIVIKDIVVSQSYLDQGKVSYDIQSISVVDDRLFKDLITTSTDCHVIAVAEVPEIQTEKIFEGANALILVAHAIQDPGNLGTMMRTALAASAAGMILTRGTVDPFNPKVVRAASGALFGLPLIWDMDFLDAVKLCRQHGLKLVACDPEAPKAYFDADLTGALALIMGNEGQGLTHADLVACDEVISIPMNPDCESLNVSITTGIILFAALEQRRQG